MYKLEHKIKPTKVYKWTTDKRRTHNDYEWRVRKWHKIKRVRKGAELCTNSWFHAYVSPVFAYLFDHLHAYYTANFHSPKLWEGEVKDYIKHESGYSKLGATEMRLLRQIKKPPKLSLRKLLDLMVLLGQKLYVLDEAYLKWSRSWLAGRATESSTSRASNNVRNALVLNRCLSAFVRKGRVFTIPAKVATKSEMGLIGNVIIDLVRQISCTQPVNEDKIILECVRKVFGPGAVPSDYVSSK